MITKMKLGQNLDVGVLFVTPCVHQLTSLAKLWKWSLICEFDIICTRSGLSVKSLLSSKLICWRPAINASCFLTVLKCKENTSLPWSRYFNPKNKEYSRIGTLIENFDHFFCIIQQHREGQCSRILFIMQVMLHNSGQDETSFRFFNVKCAAVKHPPLVRYNTTMVQQITRIRNTSYLTR